MFNRRYVGRGESRRNYPLGHRWVRSSPIRHLPKQHSMLTVEQQRSGTTPLTTPLLDAQVAQGPGFNKSRLPHTEALHNIYFPTKTNQWQLVNYKGGLGTVSLCGGKKEHW